MLTYNKYDGLAPLDPKAEAHYDFCDDIHIDVILTSSLEDDDGYYTPYKWSPALVWVNEDNEVEECNSLELYDTEASYFFYSLNYGKKMDEHLLKVMKKEEYDQVSLVLYCDDKELRKKLNMKEEEVIDSFIVY